MVRYTFFLFLKDAPSPPTGYQYFLDLTQDLEDCPQQIFTPERRKDLRNNLQKQSSCAIREHHLIEIINTWVEDIQVGVRQTYLHLDLPPKDVHNIENLEEDGNQEIPNLLPPDLLGIEPIFGMLPPLSEIFCS
jgi:hypothetical protein